MIRILILISSMFILLKYSRSLTSHVVPHQQHHYHNYHQLVHMNKSYIRRSLRSISLKGGNSDIDSGNDLKVS